MTRKTTFSSILCLSLLALLVCVCPFSQGFAEAKPQDKLPFNASFDPNTQTLVFEPQLIRYSPKTVQALKAYIASFAPLKRVDMTKVSTSTKVMGEVFDTFPEVDFAFTLKFGKHSFQNNIKAYSSLHSSRSKRFTQDYYAPLRFCKNLEFLDLGHNAISDIRFVQNLKHLKVLILADNIITSLEPLKDLKNLEWLEVFRNRLTSLEPLANLPNLKHLNVAYNRIKDVAPLLSLHSLQRLWLAHNGLADTSMASIQQALPSVQLNSTHHEPTGGGWREHDDYDTIVQIFKNHNAK